MNIIRLFINRKIFEKKSFEAQIRKKAAKQRNLGKEKETF